MIDIVLVAIFCYQLNRMAHERGLNSLPYILNYLAIFFLVMIGLVYVMFKFLGYNLGVMQTPEGMRAAMAFEPFAILFEIFLFLFFRKRILKATVPADVDNDDDFPQSPSTKEKKDLSYFR